MSRSSRTLTVLLVGLVVSLLIVASTALAALPSGGTFSDDNGNVHEGNIEAIAAIGITKGCGAAGSGLYCPESTVTRGQMAAFLNRALTLPATGTDFFTDDNGTTFEDDINRLAAAGITRGCGAIGSRMYCPSGQVTRGQMAAFLVRAFGYTDDGGGDLFIDDDGSVFEPEIDRLGTAGVTRGCNPPTNDRYCPSSPVRRDQMASFLARALELPPIIPPPTTTTTSTSTSTTSTSTTTTTRPPPPPPPTSGWDPATCTFDGIPMWGTVQVVDFFADVQIQEVNFFPDLKVQVVDFFPSSCGKWQQVDFFADFTVEFVDFFPDLQIQYVDFFPGVP